MLQVPERTAALDLWDGSKVIGGRRGGRGPLERPGVPGVAARDCPLEVRPQQVDDKNHGTKRLKEDTNCHDEIPGIPASTWLIGVDSSRHAKEPGNVHEVECQVETDEEQPEVQLTYSLVVHLPRHLRKPVVEGAEDREHDRAYDHVVKVCNNEVRIAQLPVEGSRTQHDSGQTGNQTLEEKGNAKQHRLSELNLSSPHGGQPVENFDSGRDRDRHG